MPKEYSPFTPGQPAGVEFFVGRPRQVKRLTSRVVSAGEGKLQVGFLSGERGIGKSSLASFVRYVTERDHAVLGLHTFLGGVRTLEEMARRVFDRLLKESIGKGWESTIKEFFGKHIRKVGLFGVSLEFGAPESDLRRLVHDFAPALQNLMNKMSRRKKGLFLVLDDINGLASSPEFANWIKSLIDEIATSRMKIPLCLLLVGVEERRRNLVALQPSLARVFNLIDITPWSKPETREFFENAFAKVNVPLHKGALDVLCRFTGGLPVLAHEIGDAVFNIDEDGRIDEQDALEGVMAAAEIVGRKHLEPRVFKAIRSVRYRAILRKITRRPFEIQFQRSDLSQRLDPDERKVLDNFLTRMKRLDVLRAEPDAGRGAYRFGNHLHYLYFWLEAQRAKGASKH